MDVAIPFKDYLPHKDDQNEYLFDHIFSTQIKDIFNYFLSDKTSISHS